MKTYRQFSNEASFAIENLVSEAEVLRMLLIEDEKKKKKFPLTEKQILKLKNSPTHWQGLK